MVSFRDAAMELIAAYPDARPYVRYVEMSLNFPIHSDSHWEALWCKVAGKEYAIICVVN